MPGRIEKGGGGSVTHLVDAAAGSVEQCAAAWGVQHAAVVR
jgi:hypothetical protein